MFNDLGNIFFGGLFNARLYQLPILPTDSQINMKKKLFFNQVGQDINGKSLGLGGAVFLHTDDEICHVSRTVWNPIHQRFWMKRAFSDMTAVNTFGEYDSKNGTARIYCNDSCDEHYINICGLESRQVEKLRQLHSHWKIEANKPCYENTIITV